MNLSRIEQLLKFLEEDPEDTFSLYALALEYKKSDPSEAERIFNQLLSSYPDYLPTYYQAAALLEEKGEFDNALKVYEAGMKVAKEQNDTGTYKELQAAYTMLLS